MKMGEKLEDICDVGGRAEEWSGVQGAEGAQEEAQEVGYSEEEAVGDLARDISLSSSGGSGTSGGFGKGSAGRFDYAR